MSEFLSNDLMAGLVVFLVAIPLCLGIALASGAPLFAGIIAGIMGGIVVGAISGSHVSVSGPAAGLTVICAEAIRTIGSFEGFLTAVVLAGFIQIGFGFCRLGVIGEYCPNAVIKGMLSGIGAVIIIKQIPHALGRSSDHPGDMSFWQLGDGENSITSLLGAFLNLHPAATIISLTGIVLLTVWEIGAKRGIKVLKIVPASLAVVVVGVVLDRILSAVWPDITLRSVPGHHVQIPVFRSIEDVFVSLSLPSFGALFNAKVLVVALTLAAVGSVESLLSLEASDKLDPYKRITSTNRELKAQGVGNICSGLLGGLPVTAVILRSSTNIYAGGKTKLSAMFHGVLLLFCALFLPTVLNLIPLSALAAILILVGFKLVSPKIVREVFSSGPDQFLPFMATFIAILFTNLLTGVLVGLALGLFLVLKTNHHDAVSLVNDGNQYLMRLNKDVSFVNKSELKRALRTIPDGATVFIDGTKAMFIDKDAYDLLDDFEEQARHRDISVEFKNVQRKTLAFLSKNPE